MVLGIIGYRNHASKLLNICLGTRQFSKIFIFCHNDKISIKLNSENKEKKIRYTNDLNDLKLIKAVIISSPNHTHIKYLKFFLKRNVYIFCEKPPCINLKDFNFLKNLNKKFKDRIYFNHNFQVSDFKEKIKKLIFQKKNGQTNFVSINISHGIAFNKNKYKNWRKKQDSIFDNIIGNLGIHYLELMVSFYGKIKNIRFLYKNNSKNKSLDTGFIFIEFYKNVIVNMYFSYAGTFEQNINFYLTNSTIKLKNKKIEYYYPRDTYDNEGKYCYPKPKCYLLSDNIQKDNLKSSIKFFLNKVKNNKKIEQKFFDNCLYINKILLDHNSHFKKYNKFD